MKEKIQPIPDGLVCDRCGSESTYAMPVAPYWWEDTNNGNVYCNDYCYDQATGAIAEANGRSRFPEESKY